MCNHCCVTVVLVVTYLFTATFYDTQNEEFTIYSDYADNYMEAVMMVDKLVKKPGAPEYLGVRVSVCVCVCACVRACVYNSIGILMLQIHLSIFCT